MTDNTDRTVTKLLATLRTHSPAKVRAYTSDDEYRDIAVPTRRKKWAQVIAAVEARAWSRCELLDRSGAVLAYVENTDPAQGVEDVGAPAPAKLSSEYQLAVKITELCLKAQREAMSFRDSEMKELLGAHGQVIKEMVTGMQVLSELYKEHVTVASEVAGLNAEAEARAAAGNGGQLKELIEAAPLIMQVLPMLKQLLGSGDAPAVAPNGRTH